MGLLSVTVGTSGDPRGNRKGDLVGQDDGTAEARRWGLGRRLGGRAPSSGRKDHCPTVFEVGGGRDPAVTSVLCRRRLELSV